MFKHHFHLLTVLAAALFCIAPVAGQTQINNRGEVLDANPNRLAVQVKLKLATGIGNAVPDSSTIQAALAQDAAMLRPSVSVESITNGEALAHATIQLREPLDDDGKTQMRRKLEDQLNAQIKPNADLTPERRAERLRQASSAASAFDHRQAALSVLTAVSGDTQSVLSDKLKLLREERQRLEMALAGKEARRMALARELEGRRAQAMEQREKDVIAQELQKIVNLRVEELRQYRDRAARLGAAIAASELEQKIREGELAISEAKIRLAEREAALSKAGKGELTDRLTDELTLVSVDVTDLQLQLDRVRLVLELYNPREMDAKSLDRAIESEPLLVAGNTGARPALYNELNQQLMKLNAERFSLMVTAVQIVEETNPDYLMNLGGRGGGGFGGMRGGRGRGE